MILIFSNSLRIIAKLKNNYGATVGFWRYKVNHFQKLKGSSIFHELPMNHS